MPDTVVLRGGDLILDGRIVQGADLVISGGAITEIGERGTVDASGASEFDAVGLYVAPGFIDLHIHGTKEFLIDRGADDLASLCSLLPEFGVTGFLPAVLPLPSGKDVELLSSLAGVESKGASIFGFFLEGPFLKLTGAIPEDALGRPDRERAEKLIEAANPYRTIFAVSPDLEGVIDLIPLMAGRRTPDGRTPVFITHTGATVEETQAGIEAGISHATHFYDVFPCPAVSDPGVRPCGAVEAILADDSVTVDFILDGEHVDPVAVQVALRCKGRDGVCLVTDANLGAALPPGRYEGLGGSSIEFSYPGAPARLAGKVHNAGSLAGSGLTMDRAVRNAVSMLGADLPLAVKMASSNPARVLGLDGKTGSLQVGYDADVVVLDRELSVQATFVKGRAVYSV